MRSSTFIGVIPSRAAERDLTNAWQDLERQGRARPPVEKIPLPPRVARGPRDDSDAGTVSPPEKRPRNSHRVSTFSDTLDTFVSSRVDEVGPTPQGDWSVPTLGRTRPDPHFFPAPVGVDTDAANARAAPAWHGAEQGPVRHSGSNACSEQGRGSATPGACACQPARVPSHRLSDCWLSVEA